MAEDRIRRRALTPRAAQPLRRGVRGETPPSAIAPQTATGAPVAHDVRPTRYAAPLPATARGPILGRAQRRAKGTADGY